MGARGLYGRLNGSEFPYSGHFWPVWALWMGERKKIRSTLVSDYENGHFPIQSGDIVDTVLITGHGQEVRINKHQKQPPKSTTKSNQ